MLFRSEGGKLRAEGDKLWAEGSKLWAEGDKLRAEGNKLWAEGNKLWAEGILKAHGNVLVEWLWNGIAFDCKVEGVLYEHKNIRVTLSASKRSAKAVK